MSRRLLVLAFLIAIAAGCSVPAPDPDRDAAAGHLRDHLHGGDVELVKWWPVKPLPEHNRLWHEVFDPAVKDTRATAPPDQADAAAAWYEKNRDETASAPPPKVARITYRTTNKAGAKELAEDLVVFKPDGSVLKRITEGSVFADRRLWERRGFLFPE